MFILRREPPEVRRKLSRFHHDEPAISAISEAELRAGAEKSATPGESHQRIDALLEFILAPFDGSCAAIYGRIWSELARRGTPIGTLDALIAAFALAHDAIVVTDNVAEYARVPGLKVENWLKRGRG
ncbi:MAG: type II toxin-antitoxin system VapC family toxin [Pararhodobacter sp.]|nr:type II toxin-antitoxin system VapC family toxin [Pararhodobacter sp.]